jgi:glycosyltransferase involved in cell wall biosynthesis
MAMMIRANQKIALFVPNLTGGGAERVIVNLAHAMLEFGLSVDLLVASAEGPYAKQLDKRVNLINFNASRTLSSFTHLVRYLRKYRPKALISALSHANPVAIAAKKVAMVNTKVIASEHLSLSFLPHASKAIQKEHEQMFIAMRLTYPFADEIVCVSQGVANDLQKVVGIKQNTKVVFNPVLSKAVFAKANAPVSHPWLHSDIPVIIGVGRLEEQKDFLTLIKAFALLKEKRPARLMILGEGAERPRLEGLIQELNLKEDVWLPGFVDNPYAYMKQADVFVLSSAFEGLPTVLIEAMALGTPVVATDCESGPREILEAANYGSLVPTQNPEVLAKAIDKTLSQPRTSVEPSKMLPYTVEEATKNYLRLAGFDK